MKIDRQVFNRFTFYVVVLLFVSFVLFPFVLKSQGVSMEWNKESLDKYGAWVAIGYFMLNYTSREASKWTDAFIEAYRNRKKVELDLFEQEKTKNKGRNQHD